MLPPKWVFINFKNIDFWINLKSISYLKLRQSVPLASSKILKNTKFFKIFETAVQELQHSALQPNL